MAEITTSGIQSEGLTGFVTQLETAFKSALGQDLNVASETPQGQLIGELGEVLAEAEELAVYVANGLNLYNAQGRQLGDWGTLLSLAKIAGEKSTVTATITGTTGTIIPKGSRARTQAGATFATDAAATIPSGGSVDVLMRASENGPIVAAAGALTQIVDARAGWASITNASAAALGRNIETDAEYRRRYGGEVATHARDAVESIRAGVLAEDGVTAALVRDNDTSAAITIQGISIDAGATLTVVEGGADDDVARAIAMKKPAGGPTTGNRTVAWNTAHTNAQGQPVPVSINFRRVDPIPITLSAPLTALAGFPSDGLATMRTNLLQWFAGMWPVPGPGIFDQSGVKIGEAIDLARLNTPLNAVPNHVLGRLTVQRKTGLLASIAVSSGGSDYTSAPTVAISGGSGATAVAVISSRAVVRIDITNRGDGSLTTAPTVTLTGGGGTGATATATISTAALATPNLDQRYTLASDDISLSLSAAPLLYSAAVNGASLVLTYNLPLSEASVPAAGDFAVTVAGSARTVSTVAISGSTVTLTLASAVTAGQAVTVSYTAGTNPLQDASGHNVAALANEAVTNNTA